MRPKEADLTALLQLGEFDYIWTYASIARTQQLPLGGPPARNQLERPDPRRRLRRGDGGACPAPRRPRATE